MLTCQMVPTSDCVIDVPVAAAQCKTALTNTGAQVRQVNCLSDTAVELVVALDEPLDFRRGSTSTSSAGHAARSRLFLQLPPGLGRRTFPDP